MWPMAPVLPLGHVPLAFGVSFNSSRASRAMLLERIPLSAGGHAPGGVLVGVSLS